jgi:antitoxin Phd
MRKHSSKWQLQDAKQRFSEVMRRAHSEGPQQITKSGVESAWLLSAKDYHRLLQKCDGNLLEFMQKSPHRDVDVFVERRKDLPRKIDF